MKKVFIDEPYHVQIKDVITPTPADGELLVKTELSGISAGTEMMLYRGTFPNLRLKKWPPYQNYPICPGYELVGTVTEIGKSSRHGRDNPQIGSIGPGSQVLMTTTDDFEVGDRVVCLGEHGEYAVVPAAFAAKLPDCVPSEEATLAVLATTAMHAVRQAGVCYGDVAAVVGVGVLGLLTVQHLKNSGARSVVALDIADERLDTSVKCGADMVINPMKEDAGKAILSRYGILADVVIEASGFPGTERLATEIARDRGTVVILGWHTDDMAFDFSEFFYKELTIRATRAVGPEAGLPYSYVRYGSDQSLKWAVELFEKGRLSGEHVKPARYSYEDIGLAYKLIDQRDPVAGLQVVLDWQA